MNGLPYYKAYPRDFIEGTIGMDFEVKCAYRLVLDLIYMQNGNLPDDAGYISGLLGCTKRKWSSIRQKLIEAGKLEVIGEFLTNYRARNELETTRKLQEKNRENGSLSNKNNKIDKPNAQLTRGLNTDTDTNKPPKPPKGEYSGEFEKFWAAYPKRDGTNPKKTAFQKWTGYIRGGVSAETILQGAIGYAKARSGQDAKYTQQAVTWLNQAGWEQYATSQQSSEPQKPTRPVIQCNGAKYVDDVDAAVKRFFETGYWEPKYGYRPDNEWTDVPGWMIEKYGGVDPRQNIIQFQQDRKSGAA